MLFLRGVILRPIERAYISLINGTRDCQNSPSFEKLEYHFLVGSTKIENASFPYKTAISEANVKTNRMVSIKWTYKKERILASNYFIFLKILFQFKKLL